MTLSASITGIAHTHTLSPGSPQASCRYHILLIAVHTIPMVAYGIRSTTTVQCCAPYYKYTREPFYSPLCLPKMNTGALTVPHRISYSSPIRVSYLHRIVKLSQKGSGLRSPLPYYGSKEKGELAVGVYHNGITVRSILLVLHKTIVSVMEIQYC